MRPTSQPPPGVRHSRPGLPVDVGRHPLIAQLQRNLQSYCGVVWTSAQPTRVLVGVSGGGDSLALLIGLVALRERSNGLDVRAAHVNHHLRADSEEDEQWVATVCRRLEVPCSVIHVRPGERAGNLASVARELRYEALAGDAHSNSCLAVATAHQAEDQCESVLMQLSRGCGLEGLSGMPWARPLSLSARENPVQLIRPLLDVRRDQLRALCAIAGIEWRDDPTNVSPDRARARIRMEVLPALESLWPGFATRIAQTARSAGECDAYINQSLEVHPSRRSSTEWDRSQMRELPESIIACAILHAIRQLAESSEGWDQLDRSRLLEIARAVRDDERRPRRMALPCNLEVRVTSKLVNVSSVTEIEFDA